MKKVTFILIILVLTAQLFAQFEKRAETTKLILSHPQPNAQEGKLWEYRIVLFDTQRDDYKFSLLNAPKWIKMESTTGYLFGTPDENSETRSVVTLRVDASDGRYDLQSFVLEIVSGDIEKPVKDGKRATRMHVIISRPNTMALAGQPYAYQILVFSQRDAGYRYSMDKAPDWLSIDEKTGLISGKPQAEHFGRYMIRIKVTGKDGRYDVQQFQLTVFNFGDNGKPNGEKGSSGGNGVTADGFALAQNYPNPFNPSTTIVFALEKVQSVTLQVYNTLGQNVSTLISNEMLSAGEHRVQFNARDLAGGVYFYTLRAGVQQLSKRMLYLQ